GDAGLQAALDRLVHREAPRAGLLGQRCRAAAAAEAASAAAEAAGDEHGESDEDRAGEREAMDQATAHGWTLRAKWPAPSLALPLKPRQASAAVGRWLFCGRTAAPGRA